jgi:hypothetical protein
MGHNLFVNRGLLFPVLVSYERAVAKRWSIGTEVLVNGGYPDERRKGASVLSRYYVVPMKNSIAPLSGLYVQPVVGYLVLEVENDLPLIEVHAQRLRTGVLVGWQCGFLKHSAPRVMIDMAVGAVQWSMLGNDEVRQGSSNNGVGFGLLKPGLQFDVRGGIGYQF